MNYSNVSVAIVNHGCKINQYEGEALENSFRLAGFRVVKLENGVHPDVTIVNTCTVTKKSDRKSRNTILKACRLKNNGIVIATGCYAETNKEDLAKMSDITCIIGNKYKPKIPLIVKSILCNGKFDKNALNENNHYLGGTDPFGYEPTVCPDRSRVFVKIQDGCNMSCSYCKIPLARGISVSRSKEEVVSYIEEILRNGYKEVVLTGINLGDYHYKGEKLYDLVRSLLKIQKDFRIRLSSIEPVYFNDKLIEILQNKKIAPHFHIPIQSGADGILKLMRRPYTVNSYIKIIEKIKTIKPNCHIATDVIVGFPGERNKDFDETVAIINNASFASIHVFKYSVRDGTSASSLKDDVPYRIKEERSSCIIKLGNKLNYEYRKRFYGSVLDTIFEKHGESWEGITGNYIRVKVHNVKEDDLKRKILACRIVDVDEHYTYGEVLKQGFLYS